MSTLTPLQRGVIYTCAGIAMEIGFTGGKNFPKFEGHTQFWVLPLYGFGSVFVLEPLHTHFRNSSLFKRVNLYACSFLAIEYMGGWITDKLIGECPWKYTSCWASSRGYINFAYYPLWGLLGIVAEKVHDYLLSVHVGNFS